jgi:hypothetical protein
MRSDHSTYSLTDLFYLKNLETEHGRDSFSDSELVVHASKVKRDYFYIGIENRAEEVHWIRIANKDLDDLITALQYAKAVSENPKLRDS